jgi:photosystem II stability/assembly factor-like uncharacterized protein
MHGSLDAQDLHWERTNWAPGASAEYLAVSGKAVFAGTTGNGLYRTSNEGDTWTRVRNDTTYYGLQYLAATPATVFAMAWSDSGDNVLRTTDNGSTWASIDNIREMNAFVSTGTTLFAGMGGRLIRSTDEGLTWNEGGVPAHHDISALALIDTTLFAGDLAGNVNRSTDHGNTWMPGGSQGNVSAFAVIDTILLVGSYGAISRSTDKGNSWDMVLLENESFNAFAATDRMLFAGSDRGMYVSSDSAKTWRAASDGLPDGSIHSLAVSGKMVFAATDSGVYRSDISRLQSGVFDRGTLWHSSLLGIQPNPAHEVLGIDYDPGAKGVIELFSSLGERMINVHEDDTGITKIDVGSMKPGIYLLRVRSGSTAAIRTVMIVH